MATQGDLDAARLLAVIETQNEIAATALDLDSVMEFVAERARELTRADASVIEIPEGDEMVYRVTTGNATPHTGLRLKQATSLSGRCVSEARILRCDDAENDPRVDAAAIKAIGARSMLCVPLRHAGTVAGVLKVTSDRVAAFDPSDVSTLALLSGVIAAHMAHASSYELAHRESREDTLTGLRNRRAFGEDLEAALRVAGRKGWSVALGLVDIDHFKQVNDVHGHPTGDAVLAGIGGILAAGRAGDAAYRIGGDEFALLMPDTAAAGAAAAMQRLIAVVREQPIAGLAVAVTGGVAAMAGGTAEDLYALADADLYDAKARRGRFTREAQADAATSA